MRFIHPMGTWGFFTTIVKLKLCETGVANIYMVDLKMFEYVIKCKLSQMKFFIFINFLCRYIYCEDDRWERM